jgi:hypothetical protein
MVRHLIMVCRLADARGEHRHRQRRRVVQVQVGAGGRGIPRGSRSTAGDVRVVEHPID